MIDSLRDHALEVLSFSWPIVAISVIVAITLRIAYFISNMKKPVIYEELFKLFFIIYIFFLFQVVTYRDIAFAGVNYVPFKEIFRYDIGSGLFYKNVFGNMLLFLPYGIFVSYIIDNKKFRYVFILALVASLSIEFTQLAIGRVFDIDDVILNVAGASLGYVLYRIFGKISDKIPKVFKNEIVLDVLSILLIGGLIWFLIP